MKPKFKIGDKVKWENHPTHIHVINDIIPPLEETVLEVSHSSEYYGYGLIGDGVMTYGEYELTAVSKLEQMILELSNED